MKTKEELAKWLHTSWANADVPHGMRIGVIRRKDV